MSRIMKLLLLAGLSLLLLNCPSAPKPPETVAAPAFSPEQGNYTTAQSVTLTSATEGAEIRYTTDGTDPSATTGTVYSGPITVPATATIKAIATKKDMGDSAVVGATYNITGFVAAVSFSPAGGTFETSVLVTLASATSGVEIRYTTDGSNPSATSGSVYTGPVNLDASATLKAVAVKKDWAPSAIASADYVIKPYPPITDAEVAEARGALARAREFDAEVYDPENAAAANNALKRGLEQRTLDPKAARAALAEAKAKADLAYGNAVERGAADVAARMEAAKERLQGQQADKWLPGEYQRAVAGIEESTVLYGRADYAGARARAYAALKDMADLSGRLETRMGWVRMLKTDTEQYMEEAEGMDAAKWVPAQKDKVNALYLAGLEAWGTWRLDDAEESFGAAREAGKDLLRMAREARDFTTMTEQQKAAVLQQQARQAIEGASKLTVVGDDGQVVMPDEWTQFLEDLDALEKQYPPQSMLPIPASGTAVLAEELSTKELLVKAKELYRQGLEAQSKGNYQAAQEYFAESLRYVEIYKSYAVKGVYTVRLIPERRDCLWRIAEYESIYGDPFKWPKIWRRNRKLIQNPDLIYPGWQLVIPLD